MLGGVRIICTHLSATYKLEILCGLVESVEVDGA